MCTLHHQCSHLIGPVPLPLQPSVRATGPPPHPSPRPPALPRLRLDRQEFKVLLPTWPQMPWRRHQQTRSVRHLQTCRPGVQRRTPLRLLVLALCRMAAAHDGHAGLQRPGTSMGPRPAAAQQPSAARSAHADSTARVTAADQAGASPLAAGAAGNTEAGAPWDQLGMEHRGEQPHSPSPAAAPGALMTWFLAAIQPWMGDREEGPRSPSPTAAHEASLSPAQQEAAWAVGSQRPPACCR